MQKILFILLLHIAWLGNCIAQTKCSEAITKESNLFIKKKEPLKAIYLLESSIKKYPNCAASYEKLAELYYTTKQVNKAIDAVKNCLQINTATGTNAFYSLQNVMQTNHDEEGYTALLQQIAKVPSLPTANKQWIESEKQNLQIKQQLKNSPTTNFPINLGSQFNTKYNQTFPSLTLDANTMVFTSVINGLNEDFMVSYYDTCNGWSKAENLGYPPNTGSPERSARISADGYYLFFTRCDTRSENGYDGGGCDIIFCYKMNDGNWSSPQKFGATINSPDYEGEPCISSDNKTMYFVSDRKGGYGGKDIWKSKFSGGFWQAPVNCGANINTAGNETSPFIHPDNETFYFVSDGHKGMGGTDFYMSKWKGDTNYSNPINLGYPINTEGNENSISVSANGKFGIIATQNTSDKNNLDLFQFQTYPAIRPINTHCIKGRVYDKKLNAGLNGYEVQLLDTNRNLVKTIKSNDGDATFAFAMLGNQFYTVIVNENDGSKEFTTTIDLRKPNMPTNIWLPIPLKIQGQKDTLYSFSFHHNSWQDTSQGYMKAMYPQWTRYPDDSVHFEAIIVHNIYIDTSFTRTVCFSDSGYADYLNYVNAILAAKRLEFKTYFEWYKKYLLYIGFPEENIHLYFEEAAWKDDRLYAIDLNVIEHY